MHNRLFDISIPPALGSLFGYNSFEKSAYCVMFSFELVELRCMKLVGLIEERVNLHFERREIKAALLCFAFLSHLIMPH